MNGPAPDPLTGLLPGGPADPRSDAEGHPLEVLVAEWLGDLKIQGRSRQTIEWYGTRCASTWPRAGFACSTS